MSTTQPKAARPVDPKIVRDLLPHLHHAVATELENASDEMAGATARILSEHTPDHQAAEAKAISRMEHALFLRRGIRSNASMLDPTVLDGCARLALDECEHDLGEGTGIDDAEALVARGSKLRALIADAQSAPAGEVLLTPDVRTALKDHVTTLEPDNVGAAWDAECWHSLADICEYAGTVLTFVETEDEQTMPVSIVAKHTEAFESAYLDLRSDIGAGVLARQLRVDGDTDYGYGPEHSLEEDLEINARDAANLVQLALGYRTILHALGRPIA